MVSPSRRLSYFIAGSITLGIASLAIVVWDVLDWFAITTAPPLISDLAPLAATFTITFAIMAVVGLHLRGAFPSLQGPAISSDARPHEFTLRYSWPYKLFAPLCLVLGISLPLLTRYVEWREPGPGVWEIGGLFVVLGVIAAIYFGRVVSISPNGIEFQTAFIRTSLPWDQIVKVELTDDKFRLVSTTGRRKSVGMSMVNAILFAHEVDARALTSSARPASSPAAS